MPARRPDPVPAIDAVVQVFAKAPVAGKVKTRLIPALGPERAAALHAALVCRALHTAQHAAIGSVELWCAPDTHHPFFDGCAARYGVSLHPQARGDLGTRMGRALEAGLERAPIALLMGCDCPSLTSLELHDAARRLAGSDEQVMLGPAHDGGYVALGLRRFSWRLFRNMPWGTDRVLAETRARLAELRWTWFELAAHWDIDRPEDLPRLGRIPGFPDPELANDLPADLWDIGQPSEGPGTR